MRQLQTHQKSVSSTIQVFNKTRKGTNSLYVVQTWLQQLVFKHAADIHGCAFMNFVLLTGMKTNILNITTTFGREKNARMVHTCSFKWCHTFAVASFWWIHAVWSDEHFFLFTPKMGAPYCSIQSSMYILNVDRFNSFNPFVNMNIEGVLLNYILSWKMMVDQNPWCKKNGTV